MSEVVYMDVCCLKRAFDDQRSTRVQLETAAIATLLSYVEIANPMRLLEILPGGER